MKRVAALDPGYENLKSIEAEVSGTENGAKPTKAKLPWRALPAIEVTAHLWQTQLPSLPVGVHAVEVRATDQWNRVFEERRIVRVV
jgi:hypothetical protein